MIEDRPDPTLLSLSLPVLGKILEREQERGARTLARTPPREDQPTPGRRPLRLAGVGLLPLQRAAVREAAEREALVARIVTALRVTTPMGPEAVEQFGKDCEGLSTETLREMLLRICAGEPVPSPRALAGLAAGQIVDVADALAAVRDAAAAEIERFAVDLCASWKRRPARGRHPLMRLFRW